ARQRARRVDGEHVDLLPEADQMEAEGLDESALAHPGHAAHADAGGAARVGEHELEEPLRRALVVGARALDQRDRLGERAPAPRAHVGGQRLGAARRRWRHYAAVPPPSPISWSTRRAAFGIFVPGPKIAFTPALSRKAESWGGRMRPRGSTMHPCTGGGTTGLSGARRVRGRAAAGR